MYNLTALDNGTNILELVTTINTASNEAFIGGLLIVIWIILFIAFKNYETITAIRTASFSVSVISILLFTLNLLSVQYMVMPIILTGLTVFYSMLRK